MIATSIALIGIALIVWKFGASLDEAEKAQAEYACSIMELMDGIRFDLNKYQEEIEYLEKELNKSHNEY